MDKLALCGSRARSPRFDKSSGLIGVEGWLCEVEDVHDRHRSFRADGTPQRSWSGEAGRVHFHVAGACPCTGNFPGGFLYIGIGTRGPRAGDVKIGWSKNPKRRMAEQHLEPVTTAPDTANRTGETALHAHFKKYLVTGEWFKAAPYVLAYVRSLEVILP